MEHPDYVSSLAFSPDGALLASTGQDGVTRLFDSGTGRLVLTLSGQGGSIGGASFSSDGSRLATVSSNLSVRVWDLTAARAAEVETIEVPELRRILDVAISDDLLAISGRPCAVGICLGQVIVQERHGERSLVISDHIGGGTGLSHDGRVLSQRGWIRDGTRVFGPVSVRDAWSGDVLYELEGICPDGMFEPLVCGEPGGDGGPWDEQARTARFSPDGTILAMAGSSSGFMTWDARSGELLHVLAPVGAWGSVAFSPDGHLLAVPHAFDPWISLHDPRTMDEVGRIELADAFRVEFSPDGRWLGVVSGLLQTHIYKVGTWDEPWTVLPRNAYDLDFTADGSRIATADEDGVLRVWDTLSGLLVQEVPVAKRGQGFEVAQVHFVDEGRRLLTVDHGALLVMALDSEELLEVARSRLTRDFSDDECQKYLHLDSCSERIRD
jgi:WD40 repeat protein